MKNAHRSKKILRYAFDTVWERLDDAGEQQMATPSGSKFAVSATQRKRTAEHEDPRFFRVIHDGKEFARIYPCCWGHTTNCHGTRIGGYSDALDAWTQGLIMSVDSLILRPSEMVIQRLEKLLNAVEMDYKRASEGLPEAPGVYLIYDRRQKKYVYVGKTSNLRDSIQQHAQRQGRFSRFHGQPIQEALISNKVCRDSGDASDYLLQNCRVKHIVLRDQQGRVHPWKLRSLVEHYAISVIEPEYNIAGESQH